jgi:hypothetical protein
LSRRPHWLRSDRLAMELDDVVRRSHCAGAEPAVEAEAWRGGRRAVRRGPVQ